MDNQYNFFFDEIKEFLIFLGIEKKDVICGCSKDEIRAVENKFGILPVGYKAYLESFGRNSLSSFFDGAQFSYDDYDDINEFVKDTLENEHFEITRPYIPIGHRRYDYFYFFYLDQPQEDDPILWWYNPYVNDDKENPTTAQRRLTDLILSHFRDTLHDFPAGFHFVDKKETDENIIRRRYENWARKIVSVVDYINSYTTENKLIEKIHDILLSYFDSQKATILELAKSYTEPQMKASDKPAEIIRQQPEIQNIKDKEHANESPVINVKSNIWNKLFSWLR